MTELRLFSKVSGQQATGDLQEVSLLEKHSRLLSEALPRGWACCPQGWERQLWLGLNSWTFSLGYLRKISASGQFNK